MLAVPVAAERVAPEPVLLPQLAPPVLEPLQVTDPGQEVAVGARQLAEVDGPQLGDGVPVGAVEPAQRRSPAGGQGALLSVPVAVERFGENALQQLVAIAAQLGGLRSEIGGLTELLPEGRQIATDR